MKQMYHPNMDRWLLPPPRELMLEVIKNSGVSRRRFAAFYDICWLSINDACISDENKSHRAKQRSDWSIPARYWHIFYETESGKRWLEKNPHVIAKNIPRIRNHADNHHLKKHTTASPKKSIKEQKIIKDPILQSLL